MGGGEGGGGGEGNVVLTIFFAVLNPKDPCVQIEMIDRRRSALFHHPNHVAVFVHLVV